MGYTAQPGAEFNVVGSFNDFFTTQLTAKGLPAWLASAQVMHDWPQEPLPLPVWSVVHLGSEPVEVAQGRNLDPGWRGAQRVGLAEIDCWLSYASAQPNGPGYLRQMRDMAARVFATGASFPILDLYGTTGNPTGNGTIVRVDPVRGVPAPADTNADVMRARLLVTYRWLERVTAG